MEQRMLRRRRIKQVETLEERLTREVKRLKEEARGTPLGIERERLLRKARLCETSVQMCEWLRTPGLRQST